MEKKKVSSMFKNEDGDFIPFEHAKKRKIRPVLFPILMSIKLDGQTRGEIDLIAVFERKKPAVLVRDILVEKVQVYERNPAYRRFLNQRAGMAKKLSAPDPKEVQE